MFQTAGTPRACYVCYKPTTVVLATMNTVDFIYVCEGHLTDPGFAAKVAEPESSDDVGVNGKKVGLSPDEIAKVKADWEERQARKKEKDKEKEKEKEKGKKDDSGKAQEDKEGKSTEDRKASATPPNTNSGPVTPRNTHERYTLHRDIFALRQAEHRKRRQIAQANALAPRLPQAPKAPLP